MTALAITLVGLAAVAAAWDAARRALSAQRARAEASARIDVGERLDAFEARIVEAEAAAKEALDRARREALGERMGRR